VYKEEPCCAAVAVRAEGCAVDAAVDRVAARIEDEVVVVVVGGRSAIVESVAVTVATGVICKATGIGLRVDAAVVEGLASGIDNDVVTTGTVSHACRGRAAAAVAVAVAVSAVIMHWGAFVLQVVNEPITA
jgi:hypothetical protein